MPRRRGKLLVAQTANQPEEFRPLERYADVYWLEKMGDEERARVMPLVDCVYSHGWPEAIEPMLPVMRSLRLYQAGNAGVNSIRFDLLDARVTVCSNAGGYSDEVAEFALGLMLGASKGIVKFDRELREGVYSHGSPDALWRQVTLGRQIVFLRGRTLGIVGYGGIGRATARMVKPLGMRVLAFGRRGVGERGVRLLKGETGLMRLLRESDVVVLAVPLTNATRGLIGREQLAVMRPGAVLVNVARGEVVQKEAVYDHLVKNKGFVYATDVFWPDEGGAESFSPDLPFLKLENFIGTPHASGPSAIFSGSVGRAIVENLVRFYKGQPLRNVVDRSEYQ